jgi:rhamnogalacturonan endolyase
MRSATRSTRFRPIVAPAILVCLLSLTARAEESPAYEEGARRLSKGFVADERKPADRPELTVQPWRRIPLDAKYGGNWVVAGDVDGDAEVEIVSARNVDPGDVHYTSSVVVHKLDGSVLWKWGNADVGHKDLHSDIACQIHDWNHDGRNEVVVLGEKELVEIDGATGREKRRLPIPKDASDCITFARLSNNSHGDDVMIKDRYWNIWAYDYDGKLLWHIEDPAGQKTAHQPFPVDLDGDGLDEVIVGYACVNHDGSPRWKVEFDKADITHRAGHLDCVRVYSRGKTPEQWRFVLDTCGSYSMLMVDGNGRLIWEALGYHFESIDVGELRPDVPGLEIVVDLSSRRNDEPIILTDGRGDSLGWYLTPGSRFHELIDWNGDGVMEFVAAGVPGIFDGHGKRIATLGMAPDDRPDICLVGDFTGDGIPDVLLTERSYRAVYLYRNPSTKAPSPPAELGTGKNVTLY